MNHSRDEYVREGIHGVVHTANLDSFWSLVKRGIMGSYHKVSWDHLDRKSTRLNSSHIQKSRMPSSA